MATVAVNPAQTQSANWTQRFWLDLQPTPGRLGASLRIVLASIFTLILLLVWQVPFASVALYFVFIVGRDNPSVSLRSGVMSMLTLVASVAVELAVVALSDNDPMARIVSVAVVSFLAGMLVVATTVPALASTWGFIFCTLIALWERHAPADVVVKGSLWILAATGIAVGCSIAIEYLFASRNPAELLTEERRTRYRSLVAMFTLYAQGALPTKLREAVVRVTRLAATGQSGMQRLYNSIVDRNLDSGTLPIGTRVRITMLAQLMDVSAAFGHQNPTADDPEVRSRCAQIASECQALLEDAQPQHLGYAQPGPGDRLTLLDRVEGNLHVIASMPYDVRPGRDKELVALPSKKVPLLIPGAFKDKETWIFGLKISLCATLCYIFYFAVDWPGISTSVTTVLIAGLSTTGAIKQKFAFRLLGALIGGLILGLGCTALVFPEMDSITSLTVLVAILAFVSAWISGGRQFSYVGLQIIFSFYLVAFEDFHAPTELAPARDRLIGILVALIVMWFVFDQIWPVRTVTVMRRSLASILHSEAELFRAELGNPAHEELIQQTDMLRDHIGKTMAAIRSMNDVVEFEFGTDRERQIDTAETILRAALTSVALVWNELAVLHKKEDADFLSNPDLAELRSRMKHGLDAMVASVLQEGRLGESGLPFVQISPLDKAELMKHPRYGEYTQHTIGRYLELQSIVAALEMQA
jgi:multidrug resistance protein MdtO